MVIYSRFEVIETVFYGLGGTRRSLWTYYARPYRGSRFAGTNVYEIFAIKDKKIRTYKITSDYMTAKKVISESWIKKEIKDFKIRGVSMEVISYD